ncbi:MAG: hypothetical protein ACLRT4_20335 [Thomasclavelia sp.]
MLKISKKTMKVFDGSFINDNNELILIPKTNLYFGLDDVHNELEFKCKILEWCSRDACKTQPYSQQWRNNKYNDHIRRNINIILDTDFSKDDMLQIYTRLGNSCHHNLTIKFIESNYQLDILKSIPLY